MSSRSSPAHALQRRLAARMVLALLGCYVLATGSVRAQDLADEDPSVPMQHGSMFTLWTARVLPPGAYTLSLGVDARSVELPERTDVAPEHGRGSASRFALLGSLGVWRGVDMSAGIAVGRLSFQPDAPDATGRADGDAAVSNDAWFDLRLVPRLRLWGDASGNAVAVLIPLWLPQGAPSAYAEPGLRLGPRLAVNVGMGLLGATLNLGYVAHTGDGTLGTAASDFARLGAGVELRVQESWSVLSEVCGRWWQHGRALGDEGRLAGEARLGARYMSGGWALQVGAGKGITGDPSEAVWRMLANVGFSSDAFEEPVAAASPAPVARPSKPVRYPNEASDWPPSPVAPEAPSAMQVPVAELPPLPTIDVVLYYARYQTRLDHRQVRQLKKVARELRSAAPDVHVLVEGHTDDTGPKAANQKLSRQRAASVRGQLMRLGIPRQRITVQGYGASRPVPGKERPGAHRKNRRVEFRLVRQIPDQWLEPTKRTKPRGNEPVAP